MKNLLKKQFYKYCFHRIKREKPWEYIFFDWKTFLVLSSIFVLGMILFFPYNLTITTPLQENQIYILESLRYTISVFIAITFSFIILSFNVFNKYFGRYVFLAFFKSRSLQSCITLLVCTLILLIYSVYFLKESNNINKYTDFLFIFSISVSIISFFSVFPFLINVLRNSQSRKNIIYLFDKINDNWAETEFVSEREDDKISFYQKDPLVILKEIGLNSIKEFDSITIEIITQNIVSRFKEICKQKDSKSLINLKCLYHKFNDLLTSLYELSIKEKNEIHSNLILKSRIEIEKIVLENFNDDRFKEFVDYGKKYKHWDLNFTVKDFFKKAIQFDEDEVCSNIIDRYSSFIEKSIEKLFPKDLDYSKDKHYETATESEPLFEPLRIINDLAKSSQLSKKHHLFKEIFTVYSVVESLIPKLNTTNSTKCFLYNVVLNIKKDTFNLYIDSSEVRYIESSYFPFQHPIHHYEKTKCTIPFYGLLNILDILFSKDKLNNIILNQVKAEMLHLLRLEDTSKLIFKALDKFEKISSRIKKSDTDYKKDLYLRISENIKIVDSVAKEKNVDKHILERLKNSLKKFSSEREFEMELKSKGFISDERIV